MAFDTIVLRLPYLECKVSVVRPWSLRCSTRFGVTDVVNALNDDVGGVVFRVACLPLDSSAADADK